MSSIRDLGKHWLLSRRDFIVMILALLIAAAGGSAVAYATRWGPWAFSDSVEYMEAARNLANGEGLVLIRASGDIVPLALRPPLYPLLLAAGSSLGLEMIEAARILNIMLFTALLLLLGISIQLLIRSSMLTLAILLLVIASPSILFNFTGAISEPPFITLAMASLVSVVWYLQNASSRNALIFCGVCAGLAFLARFTGIAVVAACAASLLLLNGGTHRRRISDAAIFLIIGTGPFLLWSMGLIGAGSQPGAYRLAGQSLWSATAPVRIAIVDILSSWFLFRPVLAGFAYDTKLNILIVSSLIIVALVAIASRRRGISVSNTFKHPSIQLALTFAIFAAAYATFLAITFVVVSVPKPALIDRILFPIPLALFISILILLQYVGMAIWPNLSSGVLPLAASVVLALTNLEAVTDFVQDMHIAGLGYTGQAWKESESVALLRELSADIDLVSNQTDAILFFLEQAAFGIPELETETPAADFHKFGQQDGSLGDAAFRENGAVLMLFDNAYWQFNALYGPATDERLDVLTGGLYVYADLSDGTIYFWDEASAP